MDESINMENNTTDVNKVTTDGEISLEAENQHLRDEFDAQRARMKELFLQKEAEVLRVSHEKEELEQTIADMRERLDHMELLTGNQKSEIETLQMLVNETVDASSSASHSEVRLRVRCQELEQLVQRQQQQIHKQAQAEPELSLAPSVLVQAVTKSLARKLGAAADLAPADLEDSMRKAQEDADMLRSLVVPLEEEINALKEKLRDTDTKLQAAIHADASGKSGLVGDVDVQSKCDMCSNYEAQLVAEQTKCAAALDRATHAELALKMATEELNKSSVVHGETVSAWQRERAASAESLVTLQQRVTQAESVASQARAAADHARQHTLNKVTKLTVYRQMLQDQINSLHAENERLMGKYLEKAAAMQSEDINLPDNVEELQECALQLREELIVALSSSERSRDAEDTLRAELREQQRRQGAFQQSLADAKRENEALRAQLESEESERQQMLSMGEQLRARDAQLKQLLEEKVRLTEQTSALRGRVCSLQQDLDNSEKVQQDFVRLSQSLQVQLERIREADTEVRWQHDEDIDECGGCHAAFGPKNKKVHCRHCGRIFCSSCAAHSVSSGPHARASRVCDVCHTLLVPDTAPYFSKEVPHTPD